jgi:hypothetical protein
MFYQMVHEMVFEMAFVAFVIWVAMTALEKRQTVFRCAVISSALLCGIATFLGMQLLAIVLQHGALWLLLLGWICKVYWQIKHDQSEMDN